MLTAMSAVLFSAIRAAFVATDDAANRRRACSHVALGRWSDGESRVPRLENQSTSILTVTAMTAVAAVVVAAVAVAAMTTTAVRSGAKRSENPATAMSPMLFESARAAISIYLAHECTSCHTRIPRSERYKAEQDPAYDDYSP